MARLDDLFIIHDTYVCLLSDHLLPNVIPVIQAPPQRVILLYTPNNKERVQRFRQATESVPTEIIEKQVHPYQYAQTQRICDEILEQFPNAILNVTGGTKIMALAAFDRFRHNHRPIIYVDSDSQRILYLHNGESERLGDPLTVKQYLACYGFKADNINRQDNLPKTWREVEDLFAQNSTKWQNQLGRLNWIAAQQQPIFTLQTGELQDLLLKANLIKPAEAKNAGFQFTSDQARQFINGGWFEHYVYSLLRQISAQYPIKNLTKNIEISNDSVSNELDVVFLYHNKLHVIECKTRHFTADGKINPMETIYKIDSVTNRVAGIKGKSMFASYYPLTQAAKKRCLNNSIYVSDQPSQLHHQLIKWINA
ncbi:Card1-like endonuclease domain-containing protein [Sulfobacillus thermosulfidooxidans]|uniref:Can2 n=1 Tax=Sulfobacillus thermosulfidooxidans TaxID=28034 RepID=A0A8I3AZU2_SULTH|nr:DUF1887 family CARF protein [Sulfobacillus thermosulfidooxidans]